MNHRGLQANLLSFFFNLKFEHSRTIFLAIAFLNFFNCILAYPLCIFCVKQKLENTGFVLILNFNCSEKENYENFILSKNWFVANKKVYLSPQSFLQKKNARKQLSVLIWIVNFNEKDNYSFETLIQFYYFDYSVTKNYFFREGVKFLKFYRYGM